MWMSLAPFWIADISIRFTSRMTGASPPCSLERRDVDLLELLEHFDVVVDDAAGSSSALVTSSSVAALVGAVAAAAAAGCLRRCRRASRWRRW